MVKFLIELSLTDYLMLEYSASHTAASASSIWSTLPSERPEISIISEYEVSVFRDVEAAATAAADIVCNSGLDIGDMIAKHNETEDK